MHDVHMTQLEIVQGRIRVGSVKEGHFHSFPSDFHPSKVLQLFTNEGKALF